MKEFVQERSKEEQALQLEKKLKWENYFSEYGRGVSMYRTSQAANLVLAGVPDNLRREVWLIFSGDCFYTFGGAKECFKSTCLEYDHQPWLYSNTKIQTLFFHFSQREHF